VKFKVGDRVMIRQVGSGQAHVWFPEAEGRVGTVVRADKRGYQVFFHDEGLGSYFYEAEVIELCAVAKDIYASL
jgi:ribosomal protein L21E